MICFKCSLSFRVYSYALYFYVCALWYFSLHLGMSASCKCSLDQKESTIHVSEEIHWIEAVQPETQQPSQEGLLCYFWNILFGVVLFVLLFIWSVLIWIFVRVFCPIKTYLLCVGKVFMIGNFFPFSFICTLYVYFVLCVLSSISLGLLVLTNFNRLTNPLIRYLMTDLIEIEQVCLLVCYLFFA